MGDDDFRDVLPDPDPEQTLEWQEAIRAVSDALGPERAHRLLLQTIGAAGRRDFDRCGGPISEYNSPIKQPNYPGDLEMEKRIHGIISWNAMMMVTRANKANDGIGGHIQHLHPTPIFGKLVKTTTIVERSRWMGRPCLWQGHASPGVYSRAWLEGRLTRENIDNFRMECGGAGLSSYPHPRLMPDFWEYPSVSMFWWNDRNSHSTIQPILVE